MTNCKLYTATGILKNKHGKDGVTYPYIQLGQQEHILDVQEMLLWTNLNWRILNEKDIKVLYENKAKEFKLDFNRSMESCLHYLMQRGLIAEGCGETGADALYDLISTLCIVPISENIFLRVFSFFKLTFIKKLPFSVTRNILSRDKKSRGEKKVMRIAKQARLFTAEIIKCIEENKLFFATDEDILDTIYDDDDITSENISYTVKFSPMCLPVLTDIANLYLRKKILFERI